MVFPEMSTLLSEQCCLKKRKEKHEALLIEIEFMRGVMRALSLISNAF
jgi:hypothetical protein